MAIPLVCVLDEVRLGPVRVFGACTRRGGGGVRGFLLAMRPTIQAETATLSPKKSATASWSSTSGHLGRAARNTRP